MPFFTAKKAPKVSNSESQRLLERCMVVARDSPEPTFNISGCEITEVPSGVFSLCKFLHKEALLLQGNCLNSLTGGGDLKDLALLRILDLSDNDFHALPDQISLLQNLQVLNVMNNKLKELPKTVGALSSLQTLNVQGNKLKSLPDQLGDLKSLRTLNVSKNKIVNLPTSLAKIRTLENLIVDVENMEFPASEICKGGTHEMMKHLCAAAGVEYTPVSEHLLSVLDSGRKQADVNSNRNMHDIVDYQVQGRLQQIENEKRRRQEHLLALERQMLQQQEQQAALASMASKRNEVLIDKIRQETGSMDHGIMWQQQKQEAERMRMLCKLSANEQSTNDTVAMILQINERAKNTEAMLDELEKERLANEQLVKVTVEEQQNLRKKEVLVSMAQFLATREYQEAVRRQYEDMKTKTQSESLRSELEEVEKIQLILGEKTQERNNALRDMVNAEEAQKQAFLALQLQQDAKHCRLTSEIAMLQDELSQLSIMEMNKREERQETETKLLGDEREALTQLLVQLVAEQGKREKELQKRVVEMEERRVTDVEDYWLIQFQRLLDHKPETLAAKEDKLDHTVIEILKEADASEYIPLFCKQHITWTSLQELTDDDLRRIGVDAIGTRKDILRLAAERIAASKKAYDKAAEIEQPAQPQPAAPEPVQPAPSPVVPSAPTIEGLVTSECVVCMDAQCNVVLLTCGHVCCCYNCSSSLQACPMCRAVVTGRVRMFAT